MQCKSTSETLPKHLASYFPQSLLTVRDQTAVLLTTSADEHLFAQDVEIASEIFRAISSGNPQLRSLIVVEGSLVHALAEGVIDVHRVN